MYVTTDKKLAINTDLVQTARLADDGSVTLSLGTNAVTVPAGEDADKLKSQFGLGDPNDAANAKPKTGDTKPATDPAHQHEPVTHTTTAKK